MTLELLGFNGTPYFELPVRWSGYLLYALGVVVVLLLLFERRQAAAERQHPWWKTPLFLILCALAPIASQMLLLRLGQAYSVVTPGIPQGAQNPAFAVFGALPWMIAGGMLGVGEAMFVGFLAGLARGGWETFSALTPVSMALGAALVAWLMRRDYREWIGAAARSPLLSGIMGGVAFGGLQVFERYVHTGGSMFDGLTYAISLAGLLFLAAVAEGSIAGAFCEGVRLIAEGAWFRPARLVVGPYNRSLAARLLTVFTILGVASGSVLVVGDWFSVQASARELIEQQMIYVAEQTGSGLPFFIQTGRVFIRQIAEDLQGDLPAGPTEERLGKLLRSSSYFHHLAVYDHDSLLRSVFPAGSVPETPVTLEYERVVEAALAGIPGEALVPYGGESAYAMVFFAPVQPLTADESRMVVAGWTDLSSNTFLSPVFASLESYPLGEAYVTDAVGDVLLKPSEGERESFDVAGWPLAQVVEDVAPDGSRRLYYLRWVEGYRWYIVVSTPLKEVQRQATVISLRLMSILFGVGGMVILAVYAVSRRLTNPLRLMADAARAIARGRLDLPVKVIGEDEIGQLAFSFEHMRRGLKARLDEMNLLLDVSHTLVASFELDRILPPILDGVRKVTRADLVRLALDFTGDEHREDGRTFQAGIDRGHWVGIEPQVIKLCQERGAFTLENPARAKAVLDLKQLSAPIDSLSVLPVLHEHALVGVLWIGYGRRHSSSPVDMGLLSIVAGQLGVAVTNAQLFQRAERERMRLLAVLESTPDVVIVTDRKGRISLINTAASTLLNTSSEDAIGKPAVSVVKFPELTRILLDPQGGGHTAEIRLGGDRVMFASVSEIQTGIEKVAGRVCVLWDVSHYKRLDALKSEFVSTVSHDLRAPLTLMRGYATMLGIVGEMNDQQKDFIRKILGSVDQMGRLVDNLLDLGRIEAGLGLDLESLDVEALVEEVLAAYLPQADIKQIKLRTSIAEEMVPIEVDATLYRQAIANLIDNALKYTPAGGEVTLSAEQSNGMQIIHIRDTGYGVAPTDQARLFEKFYRARRSETAKEKGLGLGLAIVKSIAEQHGGSVSFESRLGVGSTFSLKVPIRAPSDRPSTRRVSSTTPPSI